jgi:hypothetical protein
MFDTLALTVAQYAEPASGIGDLARYLRESYIGPGLIIVVMILAVILAFRQKLAAFFSLAGVAILAAVFIFAGDALFGSSGSLTKAGTELAKKVNTADLAGTTFAPGFLDSAE